MWMNSRHIPETLMIPMHTSALLIFSLGFSQMAVCLNPRESNFFVDGWESLYSFFFCLGYTGIRPPNPSSRNKGCPGGKEVKLQMFKNDQTSPWSCLWFVSFIYLDLYIRIIKIINIYIYYISIYRWTPTLFLGGVWHHPENPRQSDWSDFFHQGGSRPNSQPRQPQQAQAQVGSWLSWFQWSRVMLPGTSKDMGPL